MSREPESAGTESFTGWRWVLVGLAGSWLLRLVYLTVRTREFGRENWARGRRLGPGPLVFALWHGRMLGNCWHDRGQGVCVLNSHHRDAEIIVRVVTRLGFYSVRGSSTRGAAAGLKGILTALRSGRDLALTVDGPRGPAGQVKPGAIYAASRSGCPLVPAAVGYSRAWRLRNWDRFEIPKPFCRMAVVYGTPLRVPRELDEEGVARWGEAAARAIDRMAREADHLARPVERPGWRLKLAAGIGGFLTRRRDRLRHLPLLLALLPLELLYRLGWELRELLWRTGALKAVPTPAPAICAGSLAVGGAGKTPAVLLLAGRLAERGLKVAILSRGYHGRRAGGLPLVLAGGAAGGACLRQLAARAGDEPALLARRLPSAAGVVVCPDRVRAAAAAVRELGAEVLVLDDGFGRRRLGGNRLDLLLVSPALAGMNGHLLPAGYLREPWRAASRAAALAWIAGPDETPPAELPRAPGRELLHLERAPGSVFPLERWQAGGEQGEPAAEALRGRRLLAFCGLARPEGFQGLLAGLDPERLEVLAFGDHARYPERRQRALGERARAGGLTLVTTEKDAVKLDPRWLEAECLVLRLELTEQDPAALEALLDRLPASGKHPAADKV